MNRRLITRLGILVVLILIASLTIYVWYLEDRKGVLTVAFLNIGQGDSIFIESPSGNQMLVDGGPGKSVLRELGAVMPFYDRTIDAIIATHPDADHVTGLIDVLDNYEVGLALEPGVEGTTETYKTLEEKIAIEPGLTKILARRGMVVDLGGGVKLQILFPDRDVSGWETNDASIVARLVYGQNEFLFTADSPQKMEKYLISIQPQGDALGKLESDVLKPGHHGSKTSTAPEYVAAVKPQYAVISAGLNNKYGHPHQITLDTLEKAGVKILRTDTDGRIVFQSDGTNLTLIK